MRVYADTSFVVSIYLTDDHSQEADRLFATNPGLIYTSLHLLEFAHSIEQNVFRRRITPRNATQIYFDFEQDRRAGLWSEKNQPELVYAIAIDLARTHTATLGTRTIDTLHVATALELGAERFWTFDDRQKKLAKAVGLKTS
ncbi:type II toxin-antitoxin system VapC family toxin [Acidobacterium sp. S8]|uniref:type II toxin-antitoxin system VapC family toxin n=1 Tax=Acidobacterium sp. S8 TaxID=1641854 RepID=UPI00131CEFDA|nr:type II toxin-antitoxin system VapC family toxin [Acidobacterium sp. S8]